ncbi:MogA/MoaB family molybdenum cofactor biosynthesis protein [Clostridium sp. Marseille-Q2269]|uniref:MogA/MoaB family molybdenum cofactor biosynthesis protein n=1 Tax=Clostridium sp. Marseille-Q2269 TaxID=2942205 RepID=UPI0020734A48|nr:MogA/MoaB family molybdenum cofactor biosynthesis protein [Clostridium sp. Marseille-Q2269]
MFKVAIITCSDKGYENKRIDESGKVIKEIVENAGYAVEKYIVLPDDKNMISKELIQCSDNLNMDLILTTGGTGFSKRDVTPQATLEVVDRLAPGIVEAIRAYSMTITKRAMLSRAVSGIRNKTLIINLPGSPKAVRESLEYIIEPLNHGLEILIGKANECAR